MKLMTLNRLNIFLLTTLLFTFCGGSCLLADQLYKGPLFDAHAHLSKRSNPKRAYADFKKAGFEKVVLFAEVNQVKDIAMAGKDLFVVFLDPFKRDKIKLAGGGKKILYKFSKNRLSKITRALEKGDALGFGEIYFQLGWAPFARNGISTDINGKDARKLLAVAKTFGSIVHIHLDAEHVNILKELLTQNPGVRFVLSHCGFFKPAELSNLMDKHMNLYAETSLVFNPYNKKFANLPLEDGKIRPDWKDLLFRHAERIMIGTDYTIRRSDQLPKLAAYYRRILGMLPVAKANKIAYENFSRLFIK